MKTAVALRFQELWRPRRFQELWAMSRAAR